MKYILGPFIGELRISARIKTLVYAIWDVMDCMHTLCAVLKLFTTVEQSLLFRCCYYVDRAFPDRQRPAAGCLHVCPTTMTVDQEI